MQASLNSNTIASTGTVLLEKVWRNKQRPRAMWGIAPFGFDTLDMITGGIQDHWLIFLGGRPQAGKSIIAGQVTLNVAEYFDSWVNREREMYMDHDEFGNEFEAERLILENGEPIYKPRDQWKWAKVITFEMSAETYMHRIACGKSKVSSYKIESGIGLTDDEAMKYHTAVEELMALPITMYDKQGSIKMVEAYLTDKREPTGFWVLDHIGLFNDVKANTNYKTGAIAGASNACMDMAHHIAPGLVLAHMNRASEQNADKIPTLGNFSNADDIGKDADLALAIHRPYMFADVSEEERSNVQPAKLLMLKTRHCSQWNIEMTYNPKKAVFAETPGGNEGAKVLVR